MKKKNPPSVWMGDWVLEAPTGFEPVDKGFAATHSNARYGPSLWVKTATQNKL